MHISQAVLSAHLLATLAIVGRVWLMLTGRPMQFNRVRVDRRGSNRAATPPATAVAR